MRGIFLVGFGACVLGLGAAGGLGCSSGDDDAGGTGGTGGTAPTKNVYVNQVRGSGGGGCLPRPLSVDATGHVPCELVEARPKASAACTCDASRGRVPVADATNVVANVEEYLRNTQQCGAQGGPSCSDYCYCELRQFAGAELLACEGSVTDPGTQFGYCYVDPQIDSNGDGTPDANPALLADCADTEKRELRFLGSDVPASDALVLFACEGTAL